MTRTSHKAHPTPAFPVYCIDWADDETIILGGGGGATKSGIHNKLVSKKRTSFTGPSRISFGDGTIAVVSVVFMGDQ